MKGLSSFTENTIVNPLGTVIVDKLNSFLSQPSVQNYVWAQALKNWDTSGYLCIYSQVLAVLKYSQYLQKI